MKQYFVIFALISVWLIGMARGAQAGATVRGPAEGLAAAVAEAQPGDTIEVTGGVMRGNLVLDKTLTIIGIDRPVIDAENKGTVVTITAPDTVLRGFTLRNSGDKLIGEDAGVNVGAAGALIEDNHIENVLFGIYVHYGPGTTLRGNTASRSISRGAAILSVSGTATTSWLKTTLQPKAAMLYSGIPNG